MSGLTSLIPFIIFVIVATLVGYIGYQTYLYSRDLAVRGQKHLEKKHIALTKDGGLRVGVKQLDAEESSARTQSYLVKAWNYSSWPEYRSRFWNKGAAVGGAGR